MFDMVIKFRNAPSLFKRLAVGAVVSSPSGKRYMKVRVGQHTYWAPSVPTVKCVYTDSEMLERINDDWEVWL